MPTDNLDRLESILQTPAPTIVTPLTYHDALVMADEAIGGVQIDGLVMVRHRIARALMNVDTASREQSGAKELLAALKAAGDALANECELRAAEIVETAIRKAAPDDYANHPAQGWTAGALKDVR